MDLVAISDYVYFSRIKTITAKEAQLLLASFELNGKSVASADDYSRLFEHHMRQAFRVLIDAIEHKHKTLKCNVHPDACKFDEFDSIEGYVLSKIIIKIENFCMWALELNYNLPDVLVKLVTGSDCNNVSVKQKEEIAEDTQKFDDPQKIGKAPVTEDIPAEETPKTVETQADDADKEYQGTSPDNAAPEVIPKSNKGGKPKGYLSEAVEHVYNNILKQEKPGLLKPSKIREFIICMKEMATKGNRHADEYVMLRIKSINAPEEGACTIITEDNVILSGQNETIIRGKSYTNNDVAKILTKLRKNNTNLL